MGDGGGGGTRDYCTTTPTPVCSHSPYSEVKTAVLHPEHFVRPVERTFYVKKHDTTTPMKLATTLPRRPHHHSTALIGTPRSIASTYLTAPKLERVLLFPPENITQTDNTDSKTPPPASSRPTRHVLPPTNSVTTHSPRKHQRNLERQG